MCRYHTIEQTCTSQKVSRADLLSTYICRGPQKSFHFDIKIALKCMEETIERQLLIRGRAFATYFTTEKNSRTAIKAFADSMRPAGRMLCRPAINRIKPAVCTFLICVEKQMYLCNRKLLITISSAFEQGLSLFFHNSQHSDIW